MLPYNLQIETIVQGRDYIWRVTGGDAHVGAAAVAYWQNGAVSVQVIGLPGHKEADLAVELAKQAAERLGATVTVIAGIHIDGATRQQIGEIVAIVRKLAEAELDALDRSRNLVESQAKSCELCHNDSQQERHEEE